MPTKSKPRVSNTATKKSGFQFRWWMGLLLVVVVAAVGIYVIYSSRASGKLYVGTVTSKSSNNVTVNMADRGPVSFVRYANNSINGNVPAWSQNYYSWCAAINKGGLKGETDIYNIKVGDKVFVSVFDGKDANSCYGDGATLN